MIAENHYPAGGGQMPHRDEQDRRALRALDDKRLDAVVEARQRAYDCAEYEVGRIQRLTSRRYVEAQERAHVAFERYAIALNEQRVRQQAPARVRAS